MSDPLVILKKILDLEAEQACQDRAVIGGLEAFAKRWTEAQQGSDRSGLTASISSILAGYTELAPAARRRALDAALRALRSDTGDRSADGPGPMELPRKPAAASSAAPPSSAPVSLTPVLEKTLADRDAPELDQPVISLRGIGDKAAARLARLGIRSIRDLVLHAPARYGEFGEARRIAELRPGESCTLLASVIDLRSRRTRAGKQVLAVRLSDGSGSIGMSFFNQPYLARQMPVGAELRVSGQVEVRAGQLSIKAPEWEPAEGLGTHTGALVPVYPLCDGVTQRWLRKQIHHAVLRWSDAFGDPLPAGLQRSLGLLDLPAALRGVHFPESAAELESARIRLAFDELLCLQLWARQRRRARRGRPGPSLAAGRPALDAFVAALPWPLTQAASGDPSHFGQAEALAEIVADLEAAAPMSRLLQGDVGCGKTAVAGAAIAMAVGAGYQTALMAPTEILAEQHFVSLGRMLAPLGYRVFEPGAGAGRFVAGPAGNGPAGDGPAGNGPADDGQSGDGIALAGPATEGLPREDEALKTSAAPTAAGPCIARLVGSMRRADKLATAAAAASGEIDLLVGTHAVIQDQVGFARLGLAIVDEQHRFGVMQRAELPEKADAQPGKPDLGSHSTADPASQSVTDSASDSRSARRGFEVLAPASEPQAHQLVMTATPIPRTLALAMHAELDQTVIERMPPGRKPIQTRWIKPGDRPRAYAFIRRRVEAGEQAYIVHPLVEESESIDAPAAVDEHARLAAEVFPDFELGLLHGRMRSAEKDAVMAGFQAGRIQILVSTSVIEVGVDVPNATVMLIEGAERFGLAQLHQFRGRVGRGSAASLCLLVSEGRSKQAAQRLQKMVSTSSGMELADFDLEQRGPGDFFGLRQSGDSERFRFARLGGSEALVMAQRAATMILDRDPDLKSAELAALGARVRDFSRAAERV